jgi:hypothetical protein
MADSAIKSAIPDWLRRGLDSSSTRASRTNLRAWAQPVTYLGLAMLAAIYAILVVLIVGDRRAAEQSAIRQGDNIVRIVEQSYSHTFQNIDSSLLFIRKVYLQNPATFDMSDWAREASIRTNLAQNFVIVGADGIIQNATRTVASPNLIGIIGLDVSDRKYFRQQADAKTDALVISPPLTLRASGLHAIILTRRLTGPDGKFAGIVAALLDPVEFGRTGAGIDLGPRGTFGLVGLDGILRTRVVGGVIDVSMIGRKLPNGFGALGRVATARTGHFWNTPGLIDDVNRLVSYRQLDSFPMIASVTTTESEIYRHSQEEERFYLVIALLLTLGILVAIRQGVARERKLMDTTTALTRSQERYALVESAVNDGIWDWDLVSGANYRSPRWKGILGYGKDEISNDEASFSALIHPEDRAAAVGARQAHLDGSTPYDAEFRLLHKDGSYRWVHSRGKALRDITGRPVRMVGSMTDISERKRAQEALKEGHDNLARAEAMVRMGHFKYDRVSGAYQWSEGLYRILGVTPADFRPTFDNVIDAVYPEDRPILLRHRQDVLAGADSAPITIRSRRRDGTSITTEVWSAPIRAADGTVTGMFGTTRDVTARKQTEALIEENHKNLERAERLAQLGHYKIDRASSALTWSQGVYRIFGLSPETFTPTLRGASELIHPDDRHLLKRFRDEAMAGREVPHATLRAIKNDGSVIEIEYWSTPMRDSAGEITGIFGTVQDITLRKQTEAALARANQELEARVSERTAELAEEMRRREQAQSTLAHMQKMEVVGQLTAGIAHDFNNLLAVIGGSLEFVDGAATRGLTAEPELIDAALRATRRGRELVQRLLAFARQSPLRAEPTAIDQLVLDTLRLLRRTLGQGIDIVTNLDAKAAVISVDRNQMANALLNLALNARDAMPDGGQLTISTKVAPAAGDSANGSPTGEAVRIVISDSGSGMTEEVRKRAFEPFFTTKPDGLGSGLGLSMVQGFVNQSGGQIDIAGGEEGGTTFTISLPRVSSTSHDDESDATSGLTVNGREKTVLLVEDDPDVRIVTAAQLKQLGYRVHAVTDGMEAIDLIASPATIDITLTDIVLPGGFDGVALVKEAMRARPNMGVLCMSGYDPTQKHRKWLKVQNIIFLEKPFSSTRLAQALSDALAH